MADGYDQELERVIAMSLADAEQTDTEPRQVDDEQVSVTSICMEDYS